MGIVSSDLIQFTYTFYYFRLYPVISPREEKIAELQVSLMLESLMGEWEFLNVFVIFIIAQMIITQCHSLI